MSTRFRTTRTRLTAMVGALVVSAGLGVEASAQISPQEFGNNRPLQGDTIRVCVDDYSPGAPFDRVVSQAVAQALLVQVKFVPAPSGFPMDGQGFLDELQLAMNNDCDVLAGISIEPSSTDNRYPDWATVSRPYAQVPFVLAVTNPAFQSLGDIPAGKFVGGGIGGLGLNALVSYNLQQREDRRIRYLPYGDPALMLRRLLDGSLAGMVIWQPQLAIVTKNNPAAAGVRTISLAPLQPVINAVGFLVSARDAYLRSQIDTAIGTLVKDGTIARLMQQQGFAGTAGP